MDPLDLVKQSQRKEKALKEEQGWYEKINNEIIEIIIKAILLIKSDRKQEFLYKNPYECKLLNKKDSIYVSLMTIKTLVSVLGDGDVPEDYIGSVDSTSTEYSKLSTVNSIRKIMQSIWYNIKNFNEIDVIEQIKNFIQTWNLSPSTKYFILYLNKYDEFPLGKRFYYEAYFSKPTPKCPNPLSIAKVYFNINLSYYLPKYYPIMVTYRFENHKTIYYCLGEYLLKSNHFQRYFIDSILHMKLSFYAELWDCQNPLINFPKHMKKTKLNKSADIINKIQKQQEFQRQQRRQQQQQLQKHEILIEQYRSMDNNNNNNNNNNNKNKKNDDSKNKK